MKKIILPIALLFVFVLTLISCEQKKQKPKYYKNFYSGEVLNQMEYEDFAESLREKYFDPAKRFKMNFVFYKIDKLADSTIYNFKLDLRVGTEYVVNSSEAKIFEYINKEFPIKKFETINGETVQVGGLLNKPTLLNFWFTDCAPCIAEMPVLNKLKKKYANRVNFISITWENKKDVLKFLEKNEFDFSHVSDVKNYIESLEIEGYPRNVFIDSQGILKYIEAGVPFDKNGEINEGLEFEEILEELF